MDAVLPVGSNLKQFTTGPGAVAAGTAKAARMQRRQAYGNQMHIKSDQTGLDKMQDMISVLSPAICHLRVMGSLLRRARNMFPLSHTLGLMLPYRFDQLQAYPAVIARLSSLRTMRMYTYTAVHLLYLAVASWKLPASLKAIAGLAKTEPAHHLDRCHMWSCITSARDL